MTERWLEGPAAERNTKRNLQSKQRLRAEEKQCNFRRLLDAMSAAAASNNLSGAALRRRRAVGRRQCGQMRHGKIVQTAGENFHISDKKVVIRLTFSKKMGIIIVCSETLVFCTGN